MQAAELAAKDAEDPLDAFMAQEILPEVKQKEQEEAAHKEEERKLLAQQLAVGLLPLSSQSTICLSHELGVTLIRPDGDSSLRQCFCLLHSQDAKFSRLKPWNCIG